MSNCVEKVVFMGVHKAFSLAEVLIAVVIISVVGLAILQLNANQLFLFEQTKDRKEANFLVSIGAFNPPKEANTTASKLGTISKTIDMGEYVKGYEIDNDEILRYYKNIKPLYIEEEFAEIDLNEETRKNEELHKRALEFKAENNYIVLIDRISMQFDKVGSTLYKFSLSE